MLFFTIFAIFLLPYAISNRIYLGTYFGFFTSDDDGRHWRKSDTMPVSSSAKAIFATDSKIYMGFDEGLFVSADQGQLWEQSSQLKNNPINSIFVLNNTQVYVGTQDHGLYISLDGGDSWTQKTIADGLGSNNVVSVYVAAGTIYAGTDVAGLSISADGGKTWMIKQTAQGLADAKVTSVFAIGDSVVVGTQQGVSISKDRGQTWENKNEKTGFECYSTDNIYSVAMSSPNTIYATFSVAGCGLLCHCLGISSDGGNTWTFKTDKDGVGSLGRSLFVLGGEIYLGDIRAMGDTGHLSISRDNGNTWITQPAEVPSIFVVP